MVLTGLYLIALGVAAFVRPDAVKRYLEGHASSARLHNLELSIRLVVGASCVYAAPDMRVSAVFLVFGWVLVITTIGLCVLPWRMHQRFAAWSVPQATRHMPMLAAGSLLGGFIVLGARALGSGAG